MSTTTIQQNTIRGLGEGVNVADSTALTNAMRWANATYREVFSRYRFKSLRTRSVFRTTDGQQTYQAPSDFIGFLVLKDENNDQILSQRTPEDFSREVSPTAITDETFTSDHDVAVSLDNKAILQYSETVTTTDGATTYTRDTDYTIAYVAGTITVLSTGSMSDATSYEIDYQHYSTGKPTEFCIEYDATNKKYVFRLNKVPDSTYIASILYSAVPSDLSDSVDPIWNQLEYMIERGAIFFGSLELLEGSDPLIDRFERKYEQAISALIQLDIDLIPKSDRIRVVMKSTDY